MCYGVYARPQFISLNEGPRAETERELATTTASFKQLQQPKRKRVPTVVQHNYHDHANDPAPAEYNKKYISAACNNTFPLRLYDMLEQVERDGNAHIVSWQPHGRCFVVHKPDQFASVILPAFFKQSKLSSFQRQLNLYGFLRISNGPDRASYYHERFLRGMPWLLTGIARMRVKGTGFRARSNPDAEPEFWRMPWVLGPCTVVSANQVMQSVLQQKVPALVTTEEQVNQQLQQQHPIDFDPLPLNTVTQPDMLLSCIEQLDQNLFSSEPAAQQQDAAEMPQGEPSRVPAEPTEIGDFAFDESLDSALETLLETEDPLSWDDADLAEHLEQLVA